MIIHSTHNCIVGIGNKHSVKRYQQELYCIREETKYIKQNLTPFAALLSDHQIRITSFPNNVMRAEMTVLTASKKCNFYHTE